jgi:hypothetical protein
MLYCTHLDDFARVEDEDIVVICDSLQSVGDRDDLFPRHVR